MNDRRRNDDMVLEICCAWGLAGALILGLAGWSLLTLGG